MSQSYGFQAQSVVLEAVHCTHTVWSPAQVQHEPGCKHHCTATADPWKPSQAAASLYMGFTDKSPSLGEEGLSDLFKEL